MVRNLFKTVAIVEAITWAALLVSMFFKWVVQDDPNSGIEGGVPVTGMIHGIAFIVFVVVAIVAWISFRWTFWIGALALLSAIPPFTTVVFERIADRHGKLQRPGANPNAST